MRTIFILVPLYFIIVTPFKVHQIPTKLSPNLHIYQEATNWILDSRLAKRKIFYYDPYYIYFSDLNPYDRKVCKERLPNYEKPEQGTQKGDIVLWDSHFGPQEGRLPLKRILDLPHYHLIKKWERKDMPNSNAKPYEVYLFERL